MMMDPQTTQNLSFSEKRDWLRLIRSENVGPITFFRLLAHFGTATDALLALPDMARRGGRRKPIKICPPEAAEAEMEILDTLGVQLIAACEPAYPRLLAEIDDPPPLIAVRGHADLLNQPSVAIVGARNASLNGRRFARDIAQELGGQGLVIVSGMARGIDAYAHDGALDTGTIGVIAGGIDHIYPKENTSLYADMYERGALVSEMPPGTVPQAQHFPRRNRMISGISQGVVVIEAGRRLGSLITARMALEQGRDVYAVPGSPQDPRNRGSNDLLRQGAILTEKAEDVITELAPRDYPPLRETQPIETNDIFDEPVTPESSETIRDRILECLGPSPVKVDEIIRSCHLSAPVVSAALLELELAGRLERHPGQQVSLIRA